MYGELRPAHLAEGEESYGSGPQHQCSERSLAKNIHHQMQRNIKLRNVEIRPCRWHEPRRSSKSPEHKSNSAVRVVLKRVGPFRLRDGQERRRRTVVG